MVMLNECQKERIRKSAAKMEAGIFKAAKQHAARMDKMGVGPGSVVYDPKLELLVADSSKHIHELLRCVSRTNAMLTMDMGYAADRVRELVVQDIAGNAERDMAGSMMRMREQERIRKQEIRKRFLADITAEAANVFDGDEALNSAARRRVVKAPKK